MAQYPVRRMPRFRSGSALKARDLNAIGSAVDALVGGVRRPVQSRTQGEGALAGVRVFIIQDVREDYLLAVPESPTGFKLKRPFPVWKPPLLRNSSTAIELLANARPLGITYTSSGPQSRTATRTSDATTEDQVVVPAYSAGDYLFAVLWEPRSTLETPLESPLAKGKHWIDLNVDARAWAKAAS